MREKIAKNRNTILMVLGILILVTFNIGMRYLVTRPRYKTLPEVTLRNKEPNKSGYAVMVPNESGDGFIEYNGDTWPSEEEGYSFSEAKCMDNEGKLVDSAITYDNGKVTLTTNKTVYCTLYFDKNLSVIATLRKNDPQNKLSSETVGGMYRYQGKNTDIINNYICFGTDNKEGCACTDENTCDDTKLDKYMYRIIGITEEGQLYLIKMKGVEEGSNKTFPWTSGDENWANNDVYKRLNGTSANGNPIFINNTTRYNYMIEGNSWYSIIEKHNWKYGNTTAIDGAGVDVYKVENAWNDYIPAKIGLMYLHDYYLAYNSERNWYRDYDTSNWIHFVNNKNTTGSSAEWFLTDIGFYDGPEENVTPTPPPLGGAVDAVGKITDELDLEKVLAYVGKSTSRSRKWREKILAAPDPGYERSWVVSSSGRVEGASTGSSYMLRPTFYLSSTIKIKSGTGKIDDPYILSTE